MSPGMAPLRYGISISETSLSVCVTRVYLVDERVNDGDVALDGQTEDAVRRAHQQSPERVARQPDATDELVVDGVRIMARAAVLLDSRYQHHDRRADVNQTLIDDQHVCHLHNHAQQSSIINDVIIRS